MKLFNCLLATGLFFIMGLSVNASSQTAEEILRKMDEHRLISNNFEMTIRVESYLNQQFESATVMRGTINDGQMTQLSFVEPANMNGRKVVMKGNEMWLVIPNVKKPIRISASQRLVGGISYGDVAAVSYADGYTAKFNGKEGIAGLNSDGTKSDTINCISLELAAKDTGAKYSKINLWVNEQSFLPVKADFFALSGKKMATAYYTAPKEWNGKIIITKMFLFDEINTNKHFSMEYYDIILTQ